MSKAPNILFLCAFPPFIAGEAHYAGCAVEALKRRSPGMLVSVLAFRTAEEATGAWADATVAYSLREGRIARHFNWLRIIIHVYRNKPKVIHSQGIHTPRYGGIFGELTLLSLIFIRLCGIRHVTTMHATWTKQDFAKLFAERLPLFIVNLLWAYYRIYIRLLFNLSNVTSICSGADGVEALRITRKEFGSHTSLRVEAHPCVSRPLSYDARKALREKLAIQSPIVVIAYGFIRLDKGYDDYADAAKLLLERGLDVFFILAGSTDKVKNSGYLEKLRSPMELYRGRYVFLEHYLSDEEMDNWLRAADILVIPYRRSIGPSGPMHHAIGAGVHVIASAIGYNRDMANVCSVLEGFNALTLADKIGEYAINANLLTLARERATNYATSHSWDSLAQRYIEYYDI